MKKIIVDNLYEHADGGFYCLLSEDSALKEPTAVGIWHDAVIYIGVDQKMRSTTKDRWVERFSQIPYYAGEDEEVISMIRRANPGETDLDFVRVFESWHESEMSITGNMLELAVAACVESFIWGGAARNHTDFPGSKKIQSASITISTEDLQRVLQSYRIEKIAEPHGFRFTVSKEEIISA